MLNNTNKYIIEYKQIHNWIQIESKYVFERYDTLEKPLKEVAAHFF